MNIDYVLRDMYLKNHTLKRIILSSTIGLKPIKEYYNLHYYVQW